jgi:hypothetical protein
MLLRTTLIASWLALAALPAVAQNSNEKKRIVNELAGAYVECGVYFQLMADCIGPQDAATAAAYHQLRNEAFAAAIVAGRSIGLLDETAKARAAELTLGTSFSRAPEEFDHPTMRLAKTSVSTQM